MPELEQQQAEAQPAQPPAPPARRSRAEIAAEVFGSEFHGKVEQAKPEVEVKEEQPKPDDTEKGEEIAVEEPTEGKEPEEGKPTAPAEATGETPIVTEAELVEHLGAPPEWFRGIKVPVTVDGTPTEATISDLVKSYQLTTAAEHRLELAKEYQAKQGEAWTEKHAAYDRQLNELAALVQIEEQKLENDIRAIDPSLRDQDPAEWSARVTEFGQRRNAIAQIKAQAAQSWQANNQQRLTEASTIRDQIRAEQAQLLLQRMPEWSDEQRANADKARIADYLVRSGFKPQELDNLLDHRQVLMARKAMLYDEGRGQADAAKKRVATVPKVMKPGAPKAKEQLASEKLASLKAKMMETGSPDDAFAYRMAKRGVSR